MTPELVYSLDGGVSRSRRPCPLRVISGQTVDRPKPAFVRYCPKADKMLRCVRLLKGEKLLPSR
jgi:hypothetical protein